MSDVKNIPNDWMETTLGAVCTKIGSGSTPTGGNEAYKKTGISLVRSQNIHDFNFSYNGLAFIDEEQAKKLSNVTLQSKDVLLNITGDSVARSCMIPDQVLPARVNQHVAILRANTDKIDSNYLKYLILNPAFKNHLLMIASSGATRNALTKTMLEKLDIILPPLPEQKAIASILTSFDKKTEIVQAQNKTLEDIAQTFFAEWFKKYKNGDNLPDGWQIEKLQKIADHCKTNIKPFDNPNDEYFHYSLPSYDNGLIPVVEKGEMIKSNKYLVESNSFLVSKLNPFTPRIWTIFNAQQNFICSTEFQVVKPKGELYFSLIHCFLNSDEFTSELSQKIKGTSSSHQRVNPQDIFDVELVIPSENDLINFNSVIYQLIAKKNINHKQIQTLSKTRDELLPRLMSGEIRINDFKV